MFNKKSRNTFCTEEGQDAHLKWLMVLAKTSSQAHSLTILIPNNTSVMVCHRCTHISQATHKPQVDRTQAELCVSTAVSECGCQTKR